MKLNSSVLQWWLLLDLLCGYVMAAPPIRQVVSLPMQWRVQPAVSPESLPKENEWGTIAAQDWRYGPVTATGTSWAATSPTKIHSLWYEQRVDIPGAWQGQRIILSLQRLEGDAIVLVNNRRVTELLRPGGEVDITAAVTFGAENTLRLFLTRDYTGISRGFEADTLRYAARKAGDAPIPMASWPLGITAPVTLSTRPRAVAICDVSITPSWRKKTLTVAVDVEAEQAQTGIIMQGVVYDAAKKPVLQLQSDPIAIPAGRSVQQVTASWANPIPWELDGGYVYTLEMHISKDTQLLDLASPERFGFREIWTDGKQLMLNGHPCRWRLNTIFGGEGVPALSFFHSIGYNVFEIQPHPENWWRTRAETPLLSEEILNEADAKGYGILAPAPSIAYLGAKLVADPQMQADYAREMAHMVRRYRNHPSVLAWGVGMNAYCPMENIAPLGMGRRPRGGDAAQAKTINLAAAIAKRDDPTRLTYSHGDGSTADISSSNVFLNFIPLQEREEWPMAWAASGNMPYMAVEFGQPYTANFWKGKRFLLTEYLAMYCGERAYTDEKASGLRNTLTYSLANTSGHGDMAHVDLSDFPEYWGFQRLFVKNTNRSWRTWGVNGGWMNWCLDLGYGDPPGFAPNDNMLNRYQRIRETVTEAPAWANQNYAIHRLANQALLAYIAGAPRHTDKTHSYFAGEKILKQLAVVWDGPGPRQLAADWRLETADGKTLQQGQLAVTVAAGEITCRPFALQAPAVTTRTPCTISLTVRDGQTVVATDTFALEVFPKTPAVRTTATVVIYDPLRKSTPWVTALGVHATPWQAGMSMRGVTLLVIGREALKPGDTLPYTMDDIARGLHVLLLEQQPEIWKGLGFRTLETMPRYVFPRDTASPLLSGIHLEDLVNWRGTPTLIPEGKNLGASAPKWTNTHAVASVVLETPHVVGFTPLLTTEFDLSYSPLLQWRYGMGAICFSTLDFTDRVGVDPAASLLAQHLLETLLAKATPQRPRCCYLGGPRGKELLSQLQVKLTPEVTLDQPSATVLVLGEGDPGVSRTVLDRFVQDGGVILSLPQTETALTALGYRVANKSIVQAPASTHPLLRAIGPNLLRWRDALSVDAFAAQGQPAGSVVLGDGVFLVQAQGKGQHVYVQVSPDMLRNRYANDQTKQEAVQLSVTRLEQLIAQLLTGLGVGATPIQGARLLTLSIGPRFTELSPWNVLGPFAVDSDDGELMLETVFPGEETAIAGDTNPNTTFTRADGMQLNWRKTVSADPNGCVTLHELPGCTDHAVAYVTRRVYSEHARRASLRLGVDYRIIIWVNGELVFRTVNGKTGPNKFTVDIPLRAGENVISLKIGSGSRGFAFWANLAKEEATTDAPLRDEIAHLCLYDSPQVNMDPYLFTYW
ncbi:MAG TPA: glycoside hydrolase family 2 TIM barrel-domain containing protein [Armatimonadota bacterium]|jgi:beta-galactosidase